VLISNTRILKHDSSFPVPKDKRCTQTKLYICLLFTDLPCTPTSKKLFSRFFRPGVFAGAIVAGGIGGVDDRGLSFSLRVRSASQREELCRYNDGLCLLSRLEVVDVFWVTLERIS
jgi:hypothetical protein